MKFIFLIITAWIFTINLHAQQKKSYNNKGLNFQMSIIVTYILIRG